MMNVFMGSNYPPGSNVEDAKRNVMLGSVPTDGRRVQDGDAMTVSTPTHDAAQSRLRAWWLQNFITQAIREPNNRYTIPAHQ